MRIRVFEIEDSDGYESTQVIEGANGDRQARGWAIARHLDQFHPYTKQDPEAGPYVWATLEDSFNDATV